jgi:hypothetical protein
MTGPQSPQNARAMPGYRGTGRRPPAAIVALPGRHCAAAYDQPQEHREEPDDHP